MKRTIHDKLEAIETKLISALDINAGTGAVAWALFAIALAIADHTDRREDCEAKA